MSTINLYRTDHAGPLCAEVIGENGLPLTFMEHADGAWKRCEMPAPWDRHAVGDDAMTPEIRDALLKAVAA